MDADFDRDGFVMMPGVLDRAECTRWRQLLGPVAGAGRRGLLQLPAVAELARSDKLTRMAGPHLPGEPLAVRALFFDKTAGRNWGVAWHQDIAVALKERADAPGFGPWSVKDGVPHAFAPADLLEKMLTVRLHLDDCDESNGALRVIPGSHRRGRLGAPQIMALRNERDQVVCTLAAGSALLMRPLLLHTSSHSMTARHRRVLHIEYAGFNLPSQLQWHEAA